MKLYTLRQFRDALRPLSHYQKGPDDVRGCEADCAWWTKVQRARTWDAMAEAVPWNLHPWHEIAVNGGHRP